MTSLCLVLVGTKMCGSHVVMLMEIHLVPDMIGNGVLGNWISCCREHLFYL